MDKELILSINIVRDWLEIETSSRKLLVIVEYKKNSREVTIIIRKYFANGEDFFINTKTNNTGTRLTARTILKVIERTIDNFKTTKEVNYEEYN